MPAPSTRGPASQLSAATGAPIGTKYPGSAAGTSDRFDKSLKDDIRGSTAYPPTPEDTPPVSPVSESPTSSGCPSNASLEHLPGSPSEGSLDTQMSYLSSSPASQRPGTEDFTRSETGSQQYGQVTVPTNDAYSSSLGGPVSGTAAAMTAVFQGLEPTERIALWKELYTFPFELEHQALHSRLGSIEDERRKAEASKSNLTKAVDWVTCAYTLASAALAIANMPNKWVETVSGLKDKATSIASGASFLKSQTSPIKV